jgi:hypothetical protein
MEKLKKYLNLFFYLTLGYSIIALPSFAEKTGSPIDVMFAKQLIGFCLFICAVLSFIAIKNITKTEQTKKNWKIVVSRILSVFSLIIWGFWGIIYSMDHADNNMDTLTGVIYFLPFFIATFLTIIFS